MVAQMADTAWLSPDGNDINLFAFAKAAHQNAVAHGWYDDQKTGELEARAVSDILQNFEGEILEFRTAVFKQKFETYQNDGSDKPEGAYVELADLLIRMADAIGYYFMINPDSRFGTVDYSFIELDTRAYVASVSGDIKRRTYLGEFERSHSRYVADWLSAQISILWEMYRRTSHENFIVGLWEAYVCIFELLNREYPGKIVPAIVLKYEYNKGRPYRHGGLRA